MSRWPAPHRIMFALSVVLLLISIYLGMTGRLPSPDLPPR